MRAMESSLLMASARSPVAPLFQFLFLSPLATDSEGVNFFDVYKELVNRNYDLGLYYHEKKYDLVAIYSLKEKWLVKSVVYDYKLLWPTFMTNSSTPRLFPKPGGKPWF
ncbi:hypothetical protein phiLo_105 [Thermus phage phiLo]|nr:hypothetical protein phiLo_105 [Thermus phage phiLo]